MDAGWHLAVDGRGMPLSIILTPGQDGDNPQLLPLLDGISARREQGGLPRFRPETVLADKACSHPSTRQALQKRRIRFTSPERSDQKSRRGRQRQQRRRPPAFDPEEYKVRNVVEHCFNWLKQFRDLATGTPNGLPITVPGLIIAATNRWLR